MELIKGSAVAASISKSISETIEKTGMIPPHLAIIRVGEKADDISYEKSAIKSPEFMIKRHYFPYILFNLVCRITSFDTIAETDTMCA